MRSLMFAGSSYRNETEMHDALAHQWIGAGSKPDLETVQEVLADWDNSALEAEKGWGLTPEHDDRVHSDPDYEGGLEGYDRDYFLAAVERLRDELIEEADGDDDA